MDLLGKKFPPIVRGPSLILVYSPICPMCRRIIAQFTQLQKEKGGFPFVQLDIAKMSTHNFNIHPLQVPLLLLIDQEQTVLWTWKGLINQQEANRVIKILQHLLQR